MFYTLVSEYFKNLGSTLRREAKYCICTLRTGIGVYKISKSLIPECSRVDILCISCVDRIEKSIRSMEF